MLLLFFPTVIISLICIYYADRPISTAVKDYLYGNSHWSGLTSDLPDTLLMIVALVASASYGVYLIRKARKQFDANTFLFKYVAVILPLSFITKSVTKTIFGRIETREWLQDPQQYAFHWFQGHSRFNGFPSGHMAVFTALFAAVWRIYPQQRKALCFMLGLLGILLVATNYHFLSDVIAGAYLGLLIEAVMLIFMRQELARFSQIGAGHKRG